MVWSPVVISQTDQFHVRRAWPRSPEHVLLELQSADGVIVAGQWFASRTELAAVAAATPEPSFIVDDVLVQPHGADAKLKALRRVLSDNGARLVVHRPGRRAVVRHTDTVGNVLAYTKVVRVSRARSVAERGRVAAALLRGTVRLPELLGDSDLSQGVLRWSVVQGETLADLGRRPGWGVDDAKYSWEAAGRAIAALHHVERGRVHGHHGPSEELRALDKWLPLTVKFRLLDPAKVARATDVVTRRLLAPHQPVLGVLHRDLHDKQLLIDDAGHIGMIDVDTLAVGERALDIANLLVHLELRELQGSLSSALASTARAAFLQEVEAKTIPAERIAAYTLATKLRLAGVYAFRPRWRDVAMVLLDQVQSAAKDVAA